MSTATPLPNALAAAHRAHTLANLARGRAPLHPARDALLAIADLLDIAALSFQTEPPTYFNGIAVTNTVPADAWLALTDAEYKAVDNPRTGFPAAFGQYVTQPVFGNALKLPDRTDPVSPALADKETQLLAALRLVHDQLATATTPDLVAVMLEAALILHSKLARLADVTVCDCPAIQTNRD
ncbi:hypothetical protein ACH4VR_19885 [Streptomyces sp. NPDC020883]|uniref:hypothetical protein n=1 Tax=Streptomyces sp. NPDC020883 TaxID=3365099 RepID=UPI003795BC89